MYSCGTYWMDRMYHSNLTETATLVSKGECLPLLTPPVLEWILIVGKTKGTFIYDALAGQGYQDNVGDNLHATCFVKAFIAYIWNILILILWEWVCFEYWFDSSKLKINIWLWQASTGAAMDSLIVQQSAEGLHILFSFENQIRPSLN